MYQADKSETSFEAGTGNAPKDKAEALNFIGSFLRNTIAFMKPFNADLAADHPDNYYMEREWRKLGYLTFCENDVGKLIVFEGYKERLVAEFPQYAAIVEEVSA